METTVAGETFVDRAGLVKKYLEDFLKEELLPASWNWLEEKTSATGSVAQFNLAFAAVPRVVGKVPINLSKDRESEIVQLLEGFTFKGWTIDRVCRVVILLNLDASDAKKYTSTIEDLFLTAEMHELVALYSALPVLAYPKHWQKRCAEGIRSNIGDVLQAIMCNNPYPSENLDLAAWNQMVLKAFFTEKPVHQIIGLDKRGNKELALILSDYAHERWAAHRPVNPLLWRCVARFVDERIYPDIERIAGSKNSFDMMAAALVCRESHYPPAKNIVNTHPFLRSLIEDNTLTWEKVAQVVYAV